MRLRPIEIVVHAIRRYLRFNVSMREVEELVLERRVFAMTRSWFKSAKHVTGLSPPGGITAGRKKVKSGRNSTAHGRR